MGTVVSDPGSNYSTTTNRYIAPVSGRYAFSAMVDMPAALGDGQRFATLLLKNGAGLADLQRGVKNGAVYEEQFGGTVFGVAANAGDYFQVFGYQDSGVARTSATGQSYTYFTGTLLQPN